ncbi:MAG TPA: thiamine diphosphokinase [Chlamydiales bacterium]|jgi:thiamine pyrophosphokinase|nr:thiamine diphosphokinase [Chlamydiales bacterium]
MNSSALIANGQIDDLSSIKLLLREYSRLIAVDGGLRYCKAMSIRPTLIMGDFDSAPPELLDEYTVPKIRLKAEKDATDLEVAIEHEINRGAERLTVFGGWGGRIDHSLTNALLLTRFPGQVQLQTEQEVLFAIEGETMICCEIGQTLSLLPICGPAMGITTKGLKWELNNRTLGPQFIGISNICLQREVHLSIQEGILLCALNQRSTASPVL